MQLENETFSISLQWNDSYSPLDGEKQKLTKEVVGKKSPLSLNHSLHL